MYGASIGVYFSDSETIRTKLDEFRFEDFYEEPFYVTWLQCGGVLFGRNGYNSQVYNRENDSLHSFDLTYNPSGIPYEGYPVYRHYGYEVSKESIETRIHDYVQCEACIVSSSPHLD